MREEFEQLKRLEKETEILKEIRGRARKETRKTIETMNEKQK